MNKHLLEMYANLVIETQEIQDGDVKKLAEGILVLVKNYDNQAKEIERQKEIIRQLDIKNLELTTTLKEAREYIEYQLENLDFEEDTKAKMLGAMVLVLLDKENNNEDN